MGDATSAMHRKGKLAVISELTWAVASAYTSGGNAVDYLDRKGCLLYTSLLTDTAVM